MTAGPRGRGRRQPGGRLARRLLLGLVATVAGSTATWAHVGTSNAYFDGAAGPYDIRVIVRTPGVIPGRAQTSIRITGGSADEVRVRPFRADVGLAGAPPPDVARPVPGAPDLFAAELWLMTGGSYSVEVVVSGAAGEGRAFVPVLAVAERRLDMHPAVEGGLLAAVVLLFAGAVTIAGAAVRESVLAPGETPDVRRRWYGRGAAAGCGGVLAALLIGGWTWWDEVDAAFQRRLYRPWETSARVSPGTPPSLHVTIDDPAWRGPRWTPLMPDHGKLMHLFLVKTGDLAAFAHLHPVFDGDAAFAGPIPALPPGDYHVFADIVHESGFAQTLVATARVPDPVPAVPPSSSAPANGPGDPDDSVARLPAFGAALPTAFRLPSGRMVAWAGEPTPAVDVESVLRFVVTEPDGTPSALEPYLGMLSHAAVLRQDGSFFVHLHPAGSINLAAQQRFERAETGRDRPDRTSGGAHHGAGPDRHVVSFPFVFPEAGRYRVVVQVRVGGAVETAAFDVAVAADAS